MQTPAEKHLIETLKKSLPGMDQKSPLGRGFRGGLTASQGRIAIRPYNDIVESYTGNS